MLIVYLDLRPSKLLVYSLYNSFNNKNEFTFFSVRIIIAGLRTKCNFLYDIILLSIPLRKYREKKSNVKYKRWHLVIHLICVTSVAIY